MAITGDLSASLLDSRITRVALLIAAAIGITVILRTPTKVIDPEQGARRQGRRAIPR